MKRLSLAVIAGIVALAGCSGGSSTTASAVPNVTASTTLSIQGAKISAYTLPVITNSTSSILRNKQNSLGGLGAMLIDAPAFGPDAQVNVAVVGVAAVANGTAYPIITYPSPVVVNLLSLQQAALYLGTNALPNGTYDTLRLIVSPSASSVTLNGNQYPMAFPATANGVANVDLPASINGVTLMTNMVMDFNVMESVNVVNGVATVSPWGRVEVASQSSAMSGTVVNNAGTPVSGAVVIAQSSDGSVNATTQTAADGTFQIHAIPTGTYAISIANTYTTHVGSTLAATNADSTGTISIGSQGVPASSLVTLGNLTD